MQTIVIDTNIIISALLKDGMTRKILADSKLNFIFPEFGLDEIYFYKKYILKKTNLSEAELDKLILRVFKYIKLVPSDLINKFKDFADKIMGKIDKKDTVFIATALAFQCPIWSDDKHFKLQNTIKTYKTWELIRFIKIQ